MNKMRSTIFIFIAVIGITIAGSKAQTPPASPTPTPETSPAEEAQPDPVLHETLTPQQLERLRKLRATLAEVDDSPLEKWIEDFKRDENPDQGIALFETIAQAYQTFSALRPLTIEKKREAYGLLLERSESTDEEALKNYEMKALTPEEAKEVLADFHKTAAAVKK